MVSSMANDPRIAFHGTLLRLKEATRQRTLFQDLWTKHLQATPWAFSLQQKEGLEYSLIAHEKAPVPPQLGVYFSVWLQQQRAALDNALYAVAGIREGTFPPTGGDVLEFPIARTLAEFNGRRTIRAKILDVETESFLESRQPYRNDPFEDQDALHGPLYWLNELARMDRHRVMHVGVGSIRISGAFRLPAGADRVVKYVAPEGELVVGETPILTFTTARPLQSTKLRFITRPEILPEIAEWSAAKSLFRVYSPEESTSEDGYQWVAGYKPLAERMDDVENTVREICTDMVHLAGFRPGPFHALPRSESNRNQTNWPWQVTPAEQRRINGGR